MQLPSYTSTLGFHNISQTLTKIMKIRLRLQPLCYHLQSKGGRVLGQIICSRRGDYNKRVYRFIDFNRNILPEYKSLVLFSTYDSNRTAPICLLSYPAGLLIYILKPARTNSGELITNITETPIAFGDSASLSKFVSGVLLHNLNGKFIRSAGCSLILIRKDYDQALIKLKSGEIRSFHTSAIASLGSIGNENHFISNYRLAGAIRHRGRRPRVRPTSMNPVDHPMGGRTRGGAQSMNKKGIITLNRPTVFKHHPHILYTKRQLKFVHH